jgi:hypothetical protein
MKIIQMSKNRTILKQNSYCVTLIPTTKGSTMKIFIAMTIVVSLLGATVHAEVLTLLPVADSTVDALEPGMTFSTGHLEAAMTGEPNTPATELTFLFAQYQLPDGMTGQDIASVNSVNFRVRRASETTPKLNTTYYVYAVHDGVDSESADTYTWNDGVGYDPTHNEVRFLSPTEISYYSDPAESAFLGGLDTVSSGPTTRPFGFYGDEFQSASALQNRIDAILQDTDGRITFYMKSRANFEILTQQMFASLENPESIPAPELVIDFVPGAGPGPGDFNADGQVDAADYVVWRKTDGNQAGYDDWRTNFGATGGAGAAVGANAAVPEPTCWIITLGSLAVVAFSRRRTA